MIRYEVLLPLYHNDGRPIEPERFLQTDDELVEQFGGATTYNVTVQGKWIYESVKYSDQLRRIVVDADNTPEHRAFIIQFKKVLKERFAQAEIYISAQEIEII